MFNTLLKHTFSTKRITDVSGTDKSELVQNLANESGFLQPLGDQENISNEKIGQSFILYCNRIDVNNNDRVIIDSTEYVVKSIKDFDYGAFPHLELLLTKLL